MHTCREAVQTEQKCSAESSHLWLQFQRKRQINSSLVHALPVSSFSKAIYTPYEIKDGLYFSAADKMREIGSKKKM